MLDDDDDGDDDKVLNVETMSCIFAADRIQTHFIFTL